MQTERHAIDAANAAITGNFDISLSAPNSAALRITGYLYLGEDMVSLNARMDMCREALLRQQKVLEKPILEEKVKMLNHQQEYVEKAYVDLLEKNKENKLHVSEAQHLQNYPLQLKQLREEIAKGEDKLAQIEAV